MAQEIIPPDSQVPASTEYGHGDYAGERIQKVRVPVGVALGLFFSAVLIAVCGFIIIYMQSSNRTIAGKLVAESSETMIMRNKLIVRGFFQEQESVLKTIAGSGNFSGEKISVAWLTAYQPLFPEGVHLRLLDHDNNAAPAGSLSWTGFAIDPELGAPVLNARMVLPTGQVLSVHYPRGVFQALTKEMRWEERQAPFLLQDRSTVIAIFGVEDTAFGVQEGRALPELESFSESPLQDIWKDQPESRDVRSGINGRLFRSHNRMNTAVYDEMADGPAKDWIVGVLYRAEDYGAPFSQTRLVAYVAAAVLLIGALLSFMVGRLLGRPLTRLANASAHIRDLDFDGVDHLPRSRLAELDDVNAAFNGTLGALGAFARYVPRQLVKRLIDEGMTDARRIETRDMTIVFTDLAGFTSLASHLSAEETAAFLNRYFETVSDAITEEGGTIDKYMGDGVMAFWGAPTEQQDHASHAVVSMKALAKKVSEEGDPNVRIRIGVHTGKVVVGNFGSESRMNYTVIGDAVNVAARLQEYGKTVDRDARVIILASGTTVGQLPQDLKVTSVGQITLRGRDEKTDVFRIA